MQAGIINAAKVHFELPVSFLMVNNVVEQGQCRRENNITFMAVNAVQPLDISICLKDSMLS